MTGCASVDNAKPNSFSAGWHLGTLQPKYQGRVWSKYQTEHYNKFMDSICLSYSSLKAYITKYGKPDLFFTPGVNKYYFYYNSSKKYINVQVWLNSVGEVKAKDVPLTFTNYIKNRKYNPEVPKTVVEFRDYLKKKKSLEKIEGIWESYGDTINSYIVGIICENDIYNAYILELGGSNISSLSPGELKFQLRGLSAGFAMGNYYSGNKEELRGAFKVNDRTISYVSNKKINFIKIFPLNKENEAVENGDISSGTAFSISKNGYLLTAQHVIDGYKNIYIHIKNKKLKARLIASDSNNDTALLKVDYTFKDHLSLNPVASLSVGDKVFTTGYPITDLLGKEIKYTDGIISSKSGIQGVVSMMQTTVPVQPGNSGGALVSTDNGNVVGLISSTASLAFYSISGSLPQNVNWAVKSDYIIPMISEFDLVKSELLTQNTIKRAINSSFIVECDNKENGQ